MANISTAYGTMKLKGNWIPILVEKLNVIAGEVWAKWYYDIQLDSFEPTEETKGESTAIFSATGRWAFNSNLEALDNWTKDDAKKNPNIYAVYNDLLKGMYENNLTVEVSYSDEESGCLVLYRETGTLSSDGERLKYEVTHDENFEYNWENYMDVTGETETFYMLVKNLCEQPGLSENKNDLIELWAKNRTYPHSTDFDELDDDMQEEFKKMFQLCKE